MPSIALSLYLSVRRDIFRIVTRGMKAPLIPQPIIPKCQLYCQKNDVNEIWIIMMVNGPTTNNTQQSDDSQLQCDSTAVGSDRIYSEMLWDEWWWYYNMVWIGGDVVCAFVPLFSCFVCLSLLSFCSSLFFFLVDQRLLLTERDKTRRPLHRNTVHLETSAGLARVCKPASTKEFLPQVFWGFWVSRFCTDQNIYLRGFELEVFYYRQNWVSGM